MIATDMAAPFGRRHAQFPGARLVADEAAVVPRPVQVGVAGVGVPGVGVPEVGVQEPLLPRSRQPAPPPSSGPAEGARHACLRPRGVFEAPKYLSKFWVDQQRIHRPFLGGEGRPASVHRLGSAISSLSTRFRASHPCGKGKSAARMGHPSWYLIERSETWFQRVACRSNCAQGALLPAQIALRLGWKIQQRDSLPRGKSNFSGRRPLVRRRRPVFRGAEAEAAL